MQTIDFDSVVQRLIMQFREYDNWVKVIANLESEILQQATNIARSSGQPLGTVMAASYTDPELQALSSQLALARIDQQRISDEMSYQNHIVWMMYKYAAYIGTPSAIPTVGAFQRHCSPKDYICTKRYTFLKHWLIERDIDMENEIRFPKDMPLDEYFRQPIFTDLVKDIEFQKQWKKHEYYVADGNIAKWKNFGEF